MKSNILFSDFLENEESYVFAQNLWTDLVQRIAKVQGHTTTQYLRMMHNGGPVRDGNPILAQKLEDSDLGVRILQIDPNEEGDTIGCWLSTFGDPQYDKVVKELVIVAELTLENYATAAILIKEWFAGALDEEKLNAWLPEELVEETDEA